MTPQEESKGFNDKLLREELERATVIIEQHDQLVKMCCSIMNVKDESELLHKLSAYKEFRRLYSPKKTSTP